MKVALPREAGVWLPGYLRDRAEYFLLSPRRPRPLRVWVAIADHYEPFWHTRDETLAVERVQRWRESWPQIAARHPDSAGRPAQYSFFFPEEEYRPELLERLAAMAHAGFGDVEIHLHHDGEGERNFVERMEGFKTVLADRHGLLRRERGRIVFGFIHGNWALDNSRPDGRWCGLNNEIALLRDLGCYADFTMPCGPLPMQARLVNAVYWATDDPLRPKSYDRGVRVSPGRLGRGDLLMIPGPFGIRWKGRWRPRLECGELAHYDPPSRDRVRRWFALAPRIGGDLFIKLYTHGAQEKNAQCLLGGGLDSLFEAIEAECSERSCESRWATAWEMYKAVVRAAGAADGEAI